MDILFLLLTANVVLQVVDFVSTYLIINKGGKEVNPVVRFLINKFSLFGGLVIAKSIGVAIVLYLYSLSSVVGLSIMAVFFQLIAINNIKVYLRMK